MEQPKKTTVPPDRHSSIPGNDAALEQRRRVSRVVHDDRGNASVQWLDAPADYERPVFEVETNTARMRRLQYGLGAEKLSLEAERAFNPYSNPAPVQRKIGDAGRGATSRTDLRKLSEWIKMMRELEERKQQGGSADNDD